MKFSIITPSFQSSKWLKLCIASVADQKNVTFEHIVQDSCSDDGTQDWLPNDRRVAAFIERDGGMYDAVNRGLRRASGEIYAYLNCDEQYLPDTLQQVGAFFAAHPEIDLLFGDALVVAPTGEPITYRRAISPTANHIRLSHLNTYTSSTFFRRHVLERGHWLDPKWKSIGDAIWIYGMLEAGVRMAAYPHLLSVFTLTGANVSTDDPISEQEKQKWISEMGGTSSPLARAWHVTQHRLRKLLAGAYRKRTFDYEIYTLESPDQRRRLTAVRVGGTWKMI